MGLRQYLTSLARAAESRVVPADSPEVLQRIETEIELVEMLTRQLGRQLGRHIDADDLRSAGREGLLQAARSFDPGHGVPFRRWANVRIHGAMLDFVRRQSGLPRRVYRAVRALTAAEHVHEGALEDARPESAEAADARLDEMLAKSATAMAIGFLTMSSSDGLQVADDVEGPEESAARGELVAILRREIAKQPEAERALLERHYFDDVTFEEAAREIGLSKSWASRLHTRAIENLSRSLRKLRVA